MQIKVAIDEIFGNIAQYAYSKEKGNVTVKINIENGFAESTFIDDGIPFNPISLEDPDVSLDANQRSIGGLGIFLEKKTMDKLEYERRDNKNILMLTKRI